MTNTKIGITDTEIDFKGLKKQKELDHIIETFYSNNQHLKMPNISLPYYTLILG